MSDIIPQDDTPRKQCTVCHQFLSIASFNRDRSTPDGLRSQCRDCQNFSRREKRKNKGLPDPHVGMKQCYVCKQWKMAIPEHFGPDKRTPDGLRNCCTPCRHTEYKNALIRNPDLNKAKYHQRLTKSFEEQEKLKAYQAAKQREYREKYPERYRKPREELRKQVLEAYGNKCQCCGEDHPEFLAIDHINGGGNMHRKQVGAGEMFYRWLRRNGFPKEDFQILCHNCNLAKALYGACPHQRNS